MQLDRCERVLSISAQLVAKHGTAAERVAEDKILKARDAGNWDSVNLWCRVKWRSRLLVKREGLVFAA